MEFLLTYGWAILIVVVGISAMSYFGMFDTVGLAFQPNQCTIDVGLTCLDHRIEFVAGESGDPDFNNLHMVVKNNRGDNLRISRVEIKDEYGKFREWFSPDLALPNDEEATIDLTDITLAQIIIGNPAIPIGTRYKKDFEIMLVNTASGLPHTYKGTITGKVD